MMKEKNYSTMFVEMIILNANLIRSKFNLQNVTKKIKLERGK